MFSTIRARLIVIGLLLAGCVYALIPRNERVRMPHPDTGRMFDTTIRLVPLSLGLDLQGGIHLGLEIDQSERAVPDPADAIDRALTVIRQRIDELGTRDPVVQKVGDARIVVELPGISDPARAKQVVQQAAFLEFKITDMQGLFRDALPGMDAALKRAGVSTAAAADTPSGISAVEQLLGGDTAATAADSAAPDSAAADTAALAGEAGALSTLLFGGQLPGEYLVREEQVPLADSLLRRAETVRLMPRGLEWHWGAEPFSSGTQSFRRFYVVSERPIITGEALTDARAQFDNTYNQAIVTFELTRSAGRRFSRETAQNIGNNMAIILDGRVVSQPPVIRSQIGSRGQIELGSATIQEAQDLALVLRAGALPAPLSIVEERMVGPTLGADSIAKAELAGAVAILFTLLVMVAYYRFAGALAVAALAIYSVLVLGGLAAFGATLTVPGLAGLVLSVGIAVDANILIFERIREELALSKSVRTAVDEGFQHAMSAIVDSNVTTVITALFLFQFGTGPVRGFAVTLITGVLASMFTAVFVARTMFMIWMQRRPALTTLSI